MQALKYFVNEAAWSLWIGKRSALIAVLTIAAGLFVLGFFLIVNTNFQPVVLRWAEAAELSIYLKDEVTREQMEAIDRAVESSTLAASRQYVSKPEAARRFRQDFPDLAGTVEQLDRNPLPASFDVRLRPEARAAGEAVDALASSLANMAGVADVRYDRRWLGRLNAAIRLVQGVGVFIVAMLAIAAALTVANVVRLAAYARRDEIEIMQLVGAPLAYVRGPFVVEGVLQGGAGAIVAVLSLWVVFLAVKLRYGRVAAEAMGGGSLSFIPVELWLLLLLGGMLLGCIGGVIVARSVK
jgi:cell division transport system permease protein